MFFPSNVLVSVNDPVEAAKLIAGDYLLFVPVPSSAVPAAAQLIELGWGLGSSGCRMTGRIELGCSVESVLEAMAAAGGHADLPEYRAKGRTGWREFGCTDAGRYIKYLK